MARIIMARIIMARNRIAGSAMGIMTGIMDMGIMADYMGGVILAAVILEGVLAWVPVIIIKADHAASIYRWMPDYWKRLIRKQTGAA